MRGTTAILAAGLALAACDRGGGSGDGGAATAFNRAFEDRVTRSFRRTFLDSCVRAAEARLRVRDRAPSIGFQAVCTCFSDRVIAGKSAAELMRLRPGPREQAVMEQCAREFGPR
jgi:hypothetical protein